MSLTGGTTTYSGSLSGTTWTLTSNGTVANPSGPGAANVVRTVSMQAQITTSTQTDMRPWDYLFVDQPAGCITLGNSVTLTISLYVRGNLCLENNSQASGPAVDIVGSLYTNSPQASVGTSGNPIDEFAASGGCYYTGTPLPCGPSTNVYADAVGTSPPVIAKPTADLAYWYTNAQLGPQSACTTGSFPGGFDNDTTLNVSRGEIDLTPASAYNCQKVVGRPDGRADRVAAGLARALDDQGCHLLRRASHMVEPQPHPVRRQGCHLRVGPGADQEPRRHLRRARVRRDLEPAGRTCSCSSRAPSSPQSSTTTIGGDIGNHVNFQGALYIVNDFDMDNNTTVWGPVITRSTTINNSALINAPPLPIQWMYGLPGATQTVTEVNAVQGSYAG